MDACYIGSHRSEVYLRLNAFQNSYCRHSHGIFRQGRQAGRSVARLRGAVETVRRDLLLLVEPQRRGRTGCIPKHAQRPLPVP